MGWSGPMTHRQFRAWVEWLHQDEFRPSRDNWYQMSTQAEIRGVLGKPPKTLKELILKEDKSGQPVRPLAAGEVDRARMIADAYAKAKWMPLLGFSGSETKETNGTHP